MSQLQAKLPTDTWVNATWDEYIKAIDDLQHFDLPGEMQEQLQFHG